jgi:hypothetical protein
VLAILSYFELRPAPEDRQQRADRPQSAIRKGNRGLGERRGRLVPCTKTASRRRQVLPCTSAYRLMLRCILIFLAAAATMAMVASLRRAVGFSNRIRRGSHERCPACLTSPSSVCTLQTPTLHGRLNLRQIMSYLQSEIFADCPATTELLYRIMVVRDRLRLVTDSDWSLPTIAR